MEPQSVKNTSLWLDVSPDVKKFPALGTNLKADVVVVGGGAVGVFAAIELAHRGKSVILLEKNHITTGDMAFSNGFLTRVPGCPSLESIRTRYGADFLHDILEIVCVTQKALFDRVKHGPVECDFVKSDTYLGAYQMSDEIFEKEVQALEGVDAGMLVMRSPVGSFAKSIKFLGEGKCNPRRLMLGLLELEKNNPNLVVYEDTEAVGIGILDEKVIVRTQNGTVEAGQVVIATGRPHAAFPETHMLLVQKQAYLVTARYKTAPPIPDGLFRDAVDPYFYYRFVTPNTLLLGGCDTMACRSAENQDFYSQMELFLKSRLPGDHEIIQRWSVNLHETEDGLPYAFEHPYYPERVFIGCGLGGDGLVLAALVAHTLADIVECKKTRAAKLLGLERTGQHIAAPTLKDAVPGPGHQLFENGTTLSGMRAHRTFSAGKKTALSLVLGAAGFLCLLAILGYVLLY